MKWNHIKDKEPKDGDTIVQIDRPYNGHYSMGMRVYRNSYVEYCKCWGTDADFWWILSEDFLFPDQPERLSERAPKGDAIV